MSTKEYLKAAKTALADENPEYCIQLAQDALKIDPNLYYAHVFIGKSSHLLQKLNDAIRAYKDAIAVDPRNLVAWKGLMLVVKNNNDYKKFFDVAGDYANILLELQEPLIDLIGEVKLYLKKYPDKNVFEEYWRTLMPSGKLGQATSGLIETYEKSISKYLEIQLNRENSEVSLALSNQRMRTKDVASLSQLEWSFYRKSEIPDLYEALINVTNDDDERRTLEEQYLKYRVKVLKVAPQDKKPKLLEAIKVMVEGMIAVKHTSFYAWSLYFDWLDFESLSSISEITIKNFLRLFSTLPLGQIVYAYVRSELSPYSIDLDHLDDDEKKKRDMKDNESEEQELSEEERKLKELEAADDDATISQEELLAIMEDNLRSCKTSLFGLRIVLSYHIYLKEYSNSMFLCQDAIQLLARLTKDTGYTFPSTKEDLLVNFAVILTYHEAPKNFRRALELYDKVLKDSPKNVKARVGKGIILSEGGNFEQARDLLETVVDSNPHNVEAVSELSWVYIRMGECAKGRDGLLRVLKALKGNSVFVMQTKATLNWRIAQSYIKEDPDGLVDKAYEFLVDSLRSSKNFAPSYTSLGEIYLNSYKDSNRASKCFLKAFEIDSSEVVAAWHLVKDFTENSEWTRAEAFCKRLISSDNSKRRLGQDSWPYRVLGMSALEAQDEAKAIEWFQNAIRINPNDTESWVGLGESYLGCGRLEAAAKVFNRVLELDADHWIAKYLLGVAFSQIGDFDESVKILDNLLKERPDEECVIFALCESLVKFANQAVLEGFFGRAVGLALRTTELLPKGNKTSFNYWKSVSDLIQIFLLVQSKIDQFPYTVLGKIFTEANIEVDESLISEYLKTDKLVELAALFLVYANQSALGLNPQSRPLRSSTFYNLGLAQVIAFTKTKIVQYRESAIESLKNAIKLQNNYAEAWIVLGVATTTANPRVAQHCFIKASSIDSKSSDIWCNLALLFLRYGDSSLASEAYSRGQSLAPSQPIAWLGNALTAEALGDEEAAANLYTHAYILGNGRSPGAQLAYGLSVCMKKIGRGDDVKNIDSVQEWSTASYGMLQYLKHYPLDPFGLSVTCLILERLNDYELGEEIALKLLSLLEKSYEESEKEQDLESFARVKSQLARFNLGLNQYEAAVENALEVLELSAQTKTIVSSRTVLGLSYYFLNKFDEAIEEFKEILSLSGDARRLVVLIAQVLYVYDTEESKQVALDQLFNNIETSGTSLLVTLVIGAISVVDNLEDYWSTIKDELESLPLAELIEDKFKNVPFLISEIDKKLKKNTEESIRRSAFYFPDDLRIWNVLDKNISLKIAAQGKVPAVELSEAYLHRKTLPDLQRSIFLAPWNREVFPLNKI